MKRITTHCMDGRAVGWNVNWYAAVEAMERKNGVASAAEEAA